MGELPWQDVPTEPGYYWYCLIGSGAVRGPAHVFELTAEYQMLTEDRVLEPALYTYDGEGHFKRADTFLRKWAGPLPRPPAPP